MSSHLILTEEERLQWLSKILQLCNMCRLNLNQFVVSYLIIQLYEFMVACSERKESEPVKLKQLQTYYMGNNDIVTALSRLYALRGLLTHNPVSKYLGTTIDDLANSLEYLAEPIEKFFGYTNSSLVESVLEDGLNYLHTVYCKGDDDNLMNELRDMCK